MQCPEGDILAVQSRDSGQEESQIPGLTQREVRLIQESMKALIIVGHQKESQKLMLWMFKNIKGLADLFPTFKGIRAEDLPEYESFRAHSIAVFLTLEQLVNSMDSFEKFEKKIYNIVHIHVNHRLGSVGAHKFQQFRDKFRKFLLKEVNPLPDQDTLIAWEKLLTIIYLEIRHAEKKHPKTCCILL